MADKIIVVNEKDEVVGAKERGTVAVDDIYRVSALWITNSKGDVLLAQRALTKKNDPGRWGPAVAGTVEEGETCLENITKETEEEIGLMGVQFTEGPKWRVSLERNLFCQWYFLEFNGELSDLKIQKEEVADIKWFPREDLKRLLKDKPGMFLSSSKLWLESFLAD